MKRSKSHIPQHTKPFGMKDITRSPTMPALSNEFGYNITKGVKNNAFTGNVSKQESIVVYKGFRSAVSIAYFDL